MKFKAWLFGFAALALLGLAGCHEVGHVGDYGDYGSYGGRELVGEVRDIDTSARTIQLRSDNGRTWRVRYDRNTRVIYGNRDYVVRDLEPGDYVALRAQQDSEGRYYAETISVRDSRQDRGGWFGRSTSRLELLEGTVEQVFPRRSSFELRDRRRLVLVSLPSDAPRSMAERFRRLNEGDRLRVEGRFIAADRFELESFR